MILQSLCNYYEQLLETHSGEIPEPGWCPRRIAFLLDLSPQGELRGIIPSPDSKGWMHNVPEQVKRSSGVAANFLCDNSSYFLGMDDKGKPERTLKCFEASRDLHLEVLNNTDSVAAESVRAFFASWDPAIAIEHIHSLASDDVIEKMLSGGNLEFSINGDRVLEDTAVRRAWESFKQSPDEDATTMTCLVSGKPSPIARLHPAIKGVYGAQAMGASLVGFNAPAFESYGHDGEQGLNAPVSEQAAFAYSTALNYLLSDKKHRMTIGDTTVLYWAEKHDDICTFTISSLLGGQPLDEMPQNPDENINDIMSRIRTGKPIEGADLEEPFYVLGLAPNAARLSVRFFHRSTFGKVLDNITAHYKRLEIAGTGNTRERKYLTPYMLLKEIENPYSNKDTISPLLGGSLLRAILDNTDYPEALFSNAMLRTRATQDNKDKHIHKVTRGRAAIVRAYLIKNKKRTEEEVTVTLNEKRTDTPYVLGRLFSSLEGIQQTANPGINATIKDRYFNAACATPSIAFPTLLKLASNHLAKIRKDRSGLAHYLEGEMTALLEAIDGFPKRLSLEQQGDFLLGYYHQTNKRFEGKQSTDTRNDQEKQEA